jgi:hypothetical protein
VSSWGLRLLIAVVCVGGSLFMLQGAFDASDHRKAEHAVRGYAFAGRTLGPFIESRAPGGRWSTEITHGCRGIVRATYEAPSGRYEFDYDVPGHGIHPGNELGRAALEAFIGPGGGAGASPDGGARPK